MLQAETKEQAATEGGSLFARKGIAALDKDDDGHGLKRTLGPWSLIALGIGAIIGAGLFSLTGIAAADNAGPAVVISFMIAALGCAFAGMCYSELASMIPVAGSAYTYAYATLGELFGWIIGWTLVLEYAVGAGTVSVSWSRYVTAFLRDFGINLPAQWTLSPFETATLADGGTVHGIVNLPAIFIIVIVSALLIRGIQESARVNSIIVVVKVAVVLAVVGVGLFYIKSQNYVPFIPENTGEFGHYGWSGILRGAGVIFFAYIGFDAVSTAAQETKNPQRDMPIGILGSLLICTVLYIAFGFVLTGLVNYKDLHNDAHPVVTAINQTPFPWLRTATTLGVICGFTTVILVMLLGQSRVFYAMSRDGFLPKILFDAASLVENAVALERHRHDRHRLDGRPRAHSGPGPHDVHRNSARLHHRLRGRHDPSQDPSGAGTELPRAACAFGSRRRNPRLPRHDGFARHRHLDQARGLAPCRNADLLRIREDECTDRAPGRGRARRIRMHQPKPGSPTDRRFVILELDDPLQSNRHFVCNLRMAASVCQLVPDDFVCLPFF